MSTVYIAVPSTFPEEHKKCLERIITFFKSSPKHQLALDLKWLTRKGKNKDFFETETQAVDESDFLVAEISYPSVGVGYLIGYAASKKKKILCLYRNNLDISISSFISTVPESKITIQKYDIETLEGILSNYFATTKPNKLYKFNFIISQTVKDYIDWLSLDTKNSVSKKLRNIIEEKVIKQDKDYQDYLKQH